MRKLLFASLLLNIAACATTQQVKTVRYDFTPAPAKIFTSVQVLRERPEQKHVEVAAFTAPDSQQGLDAILTRAGEIGCDAVVIGDSRQGTMQLTANPLTHQAWTQSNYDMTAVGIRFEAAPPVACHYDMQCPRDMACDIASGTCAHN